LIVDDQSTDSTKAIAEELAAIDNRIQTITVPPRPRNGWVGKNWACFQGASYARGNYILFIDADVRLESEAIASALVEAEKYKTDLLSCAPRIVCGCFWEWLIQPLIFNLISAGFDFTKVNNSNDSLAFATGTFMLFRRNAYLSIGGHRGVAGIVLNLEILLYKEMALQFLPLCSDRLLYYRKIIKTVFNFRQDKI
jgi:glycosyltransferase involved in cell wall biosynthesis